MVQQELQDVVWRGVNRAWREVYPQVYNWASTHLHLRYGDQRLTYYLQSLSVNLDYPTRLYADGTRVSLWDMNAITDEIRALYAMYCSVVGSCHPLMNQGLLFDSPYFPGSGLDRESFARWRLEPLIELSGYDVPTGAILEGLSRALFVYSAVNNPHLLKLVARKA